MSNQLSESELANFTPTLSDTNTVGDYKKLIKERIQVDYVVNDDVIESNYKKIANAACDKIWNLLFADPTPSAERKEKAYELLEEHRRDACFYAPWEYNKWIVRVRDELLKRNIIDFWRDKIVPNELGLCWARDSDYYDDIDDPEPANFYRHAGCEAPFKTAFEEDEVADDVDPDDEESNQSAAAAVSSSNAPAPVKISQATPLADFISKYDHLEATNAANDKAFETLLAEARSVIWDLLFKEQTLSEENYKKAAELLEESRKRGAFFSPYAYNEWIVKVRDELFARKYFDFWQKVIVDKKCGLYWYQDCEYFDDSEDTRPIEFYKSGDELMKQNK